MTKEELRAFIKFLVEVKRPLKADERKGFALAIEEAREWLENEYKL